MEEPRVKKSLTVGSPPSRNLFLGLVLTSMGGATMWTILSEGLRWSYFDLIEPPRNMLLGPLVLASGILVFFMGIFCLRAFWGDWPSFKVGPSGVQFCMAMDLDIPWSNIRRVEQHRVWRAGGKRFRNVLVFYVHDVAEVPFRNLLWRLFWSPIGRSARYFTKIPSGGEGEELLRIVRLYRVIHKF